MFEDLDDRIAVVTGGGRGLGLRMAGALAAQGVRVALLEVLPEVEEAAERLAAQSGRTAIGVRADVTDDGSLAAAFGTVRDRLGVPSILVNAAGVSHWAESVDEPAAEFRRVVDINLTGTFLTTQAFARAVFAADGRGTVVNISSMSASIVNLPQRQVAYNASKAAVDQLTRSLAVEWISRGIRVNAIAPGYMRSDMTRQFLADNEELGRYWSSLTPAGRMGEPDDLDGLVVFLCSDASRYVVGESVVIDGGYSIV